MKSHNEPKATILVCDDEQLIREAVGSYLSDHGYHVLLAKNGVECLEQTKTGKPDAILLDIIMPEMDGITVIRKLRRQGLDIPILVLSARHELGPTVETKELSLGQFISKPIRLSELEILLESALLEAQDAMAELD